MNKGGSGALSMALNSHGQSSSPLEAQVTLLSWHRENLCKNNVFVVKSALPAEAVIASQGTSLHHKSISLLFKINE